MLKNKKRILLFLIFLFVFGALGNLIGIAEMFHVDGAHTIMGRLGWVGFIGLLLWPFISYYINLIDSVDNPKQPTPIKKRHGIIVSLFLATAVALSTTLVITIVLFKAGDAAVGGYGMLDGPGIIVVFIFFFITLVATFTHLHNP